MQKNTNQKNQKKLNDLQVEELAWNMIYRSSTSHLGVANVCSLYEPKKINAFHAQHFGEDKKVKSLMRKKSTGFKKGEILRDYLAKNLKDLCFPIKVECCKKQICYKRFVANGDKCTCSRWKKRLKCKQKKQMISLIPNEITPEKMRDLICALTVPTTPNIKKLKNLLLDDQFQNLITKFVNQAKSTISCQMVEDKSICGSDYGEEKENYNSPDSNDSSSSDDDDD